MISTDISIWVVAMLTLFTYSYYLHGKQNITFRFVQSTVLGMSLAIVVVLTMEKNLDRLVVSKIAAGKWIYIVPVIIGLMMYTKYFPRYAYLSRTPITLIICVGSALGARAGLETLVFKNLLTAAKLFTVADLYTSFNNIIMIMGLFSILIYFFFTLNPKIQSRINPLATLGRYYLMIHFGVRFGATTMSRLATFINRIQFLLFEWLGL